HLPNSRAIEISVCVKSAMRLKRNASGLFRVRHGTRRAAYACVVLIAVAACGNSTKQGTATSTYTATTTRTVDPAQATNLCTQAFTAAPSGGQIHARGPVDEFVIDVTNNLGANAKNIENGWNESTIALLTDWSEKFLPGTTTQSGPVIASTDADKFNSLVCIKRTYAILGTYEGGSPAGRCDYDARVVDWHRSEE